jgi:hypothetical protein
MTNTPVVYFPDGKPAPILLTEQEAIILLRLDTIELKNPDDTLRRYRDGGLLRATQISRKIFYYLPEILSFIERQTAAVSR